MCWRYIRDRFEFIYSVFGGCFDEEFAEDSNRVVIAIKTSSIRLLLSDLTINEIEPAPERVKDLFYELMQYEVEFLLASEAVLELRDAYIKKGIVTSKSKNDATHVAYATVAHAIVSWNMRHIASLNNIQLYNEVNQELEYPYINIITPRLAVFHEE